MWPAIRLLFFLVIIFVRSFFYKIQRHWIESSICHKFYLFLFWIAASVRHCLITLHGWISFFNHPFWFCLRAIQIACLWSKELCQASVQSRLERLKLNVENYRAYWFKYLKPSPSSLQTSKAPVESKAHCISSFTSECHKDT